MSVCLASALVADVLAIEGKATNDDGCWALSVCWSSDPGLMAMMKPGMLWTQSGLRDHES
jgi:hypothetical protein